MINYTSFIINIFSIYYDITFMFHFRTLQKYADIKTFTFFHDFSLLQRINFGLYRKGYGKIGGKNGKNSNLVNI